MLRNEAYPQRGIRIRQNGWRSPEPLTGRMRVASMYLRSRSYKPGGTSIASEGSAGAGVGVLGRTGPLGGALGLGGTFGRAGPGRGGWAGGFRGGLWAGVVGVLAGAFGRAGPGRGGGAGGFRGGLSAGYGVLMDGRFNLPGG